MATTDEATLKVVVDASLSDQLKANIQQVESAAKKIPLNAKETKDIQANLRGARLNLEAGNLGAFIKNFNRLIKVLNDAALKTGEVSKSIADLETQQKSWLEALKAAKNTLKELKEQVNKEAQAKYIEKNIQENQKNKVYGQDGKELSGKQLQKIWQNPNYIKQVQSGLSLNQGFNDDIAKSLGFLNKESAWASNRIAKDWKKEAAPVDKQIENQEAVIANLENNLEQLKDKIANTDTATEDTTAAFNELYLALLKLQEGTNTLVNNTLKPQKEEKEKENKAIDVATDNDLKDTNEFTEVYQKQSSSIGKLVKNITIYHLALRAVRTTLRSTVHTVQELDKQLTEQAMVTNRTRKETYALLKGYQELALTLGATTKEVAQVSTEYLRQGKTVDQALTLTKAAISAAKVASINTSESVDYLTTALNGFRLSAEDAMKVSDKFAAVAANAAVSYQEIATALSKVAAQANLAGMSIDYTTAILAKGIETTREAPETIGTALKTIIARMREIKDYGETLGGDTDLNNVENQLAYVGIELKTNNGELRSTEDVLDDLGRKWDTLNSNQQAAIAKALAGTRQQSRLIAMMSDYERVIELQEIAERSQGATMAQMATYTEGMEAAMNKVAVSWEKIVTTVTDSDVIIGIVNAFANILNMVNGILQNNVAMVGVLITIGTLAVNHYGAKVKERAIQREIIKAQKDVRKNELLSLKTQREKNKDKATELIDTIRIAAKSNNRELTAEEAKIVAEKEAEIKLMEKLNLETDRELETLQAQDSITQNIGFGMSNIAAAAGSILSPLFSMVSLLVTILGLNHANLAAEKAEGVEQEKNIKKEQKKSMWKRISAAFGMASSASEMGPAGWVIAAGILAVLLGVTIGVAVAMNNTKNATDKTAEKVDRLSNEIYKLQNTKTALDTTISKFDAIDEKIIKTTEDLKAMEEALDQAADSLSSEAGESVLDWLNGKGKKHKGATSEQEYYKSLQSNQARREFLEEEAQALERKLKEDRDKQLKLIAEASEQTRQAFFTKAEYANVRDAIYALDNSILNEAIELEEEAGRVTTEQAATVRKFTQALLENISAEEQWNYAQHPERIERLTKAFKDLRTETSNGTKSSVDILGNTTYSLSDQVKAYKDIAKAIKEDQAAYNAFMQQYSSFDVYLQLSESALNFVDKVNISVDKLNDIYTAYHKLQAAGIEITKEDFQGRFTTFLENLALFENDATSAINATFSDILSTSENQLETFQILVNTFGNILETGLLNMGQNITTFKNTTNAFYEKAQQWATMSDTDKSAFIADYNDLFSDIAGQKLADALESGNFAAMEQALKDNKTFQQQRIRLLNQVEEELKWELAKEGEAYNAAYVAQLQQTKDFLSDLEKVYKADLNWRLEQEQKALDAYKELLQKQADAQTETLEKQKQAYQDYFNEINEAREDQDYEDQATLLITNMSKLGASTNADAVKQAQELQEQLEELEKERLQELQDRAQEQILQNLDDEIQKISTQLEDIINNQQALLVSMNEKMVNPNAFISELLSNKMTTEGLTQLGFQDYMNTLKETFAPFMNFDWTKLDGNIENNESQNLILNINGGTYELSQDEQQSLFDTILTALQQMGIR